MLALASKGWQRALAEDRNLMAGLNIHQGRITHRAVAESLGAAFLLPEQADNTGK